MSAGTFALASLTTAAAVKLRIEYKHSVKLALAEADDRGEQIIHIALYAIPCARAAPKFDVYQFLISNESNRPTNKEDTVLRTLFEIISWWRASVHVRQREREKIGAWRRKQFRLEREILVCDLISTSWGFFFLPCQLSSTGNSCCVFASGLICLPYVDRHCPEGESFSQDWEYEHQGLSFQTDDYRHGKIRSI